MKRFAFSRKASIVFLTCLMMAVISRPSVAENMDNSREVIPPTTPIVEDQPHARLFSYNGETFTNLSQVTFTNPGFPGTIQNTSPEIRSISWGGSGDGVWAITGRGNLYTYNGSQITNIISNVDPNFDSSGKFPYYEIKWNGAYWLSGNLMGSAVVFDGTNVSFYDISGPIADVLSLDWRPANGGSAFWMIGGFGDGFYCHLLTSPGSGVGITDLGLPGTITQGIDGDYRAGDYSYYIAGGTGTVDSNDVSRLYAWDGQVFTDLTNIGGPGVIPALTQGIGAVTGGNGYWLVGGRGTQRLYRIGLSPGWTGTAIATPADLTEITAIGYGGADNWLIGGVYDDGTNETARLYRYNGTTLTDLTDTFLTQAVVHVSRINSICWNGTDTWMLGGYGLYNVGADNGGSVKSVDGEANVAFTGGSVDNETSVRVEELITGQAVSGSLQLIGSEYNYSATNLYDGASTTQFNKAATLTINYDPAALGSIPASRLSLYYYDTLTGQWILVPSIVDTLNNVVIAEVTHFTRYAILDDPNRQMPNTGI